MSQDPFQEREAEKYANPIPSREFILEHLTKREKPASRDELAIELNIEGEEQTEALRRRLRAMERDGQLVFTRRQCYALPERLDLLKGTVIGHRDGYGFLRVEGRKDDLYLSSEQMKTCIHGDQVLAQPLGADRKGRREARIVRVLVPKTSQIVGRYFTDAGVGFVVPDDSRLSFDILIPPEEIMGARMGYVVVVELTQRPTRRTKAVGKIVEVLGDNMGTGMAVDMALRTHEIPYVWPPAVENQVSGLKEQVPEEAKAGRVDLRSLPLVSNIREKLLALREQQKENRRVCGNCYSKKYDGYVFVDAMGNIFNPRSVTANFSKLLEQNGLRHIRFHDLRHSCASLLLANDVPLKQIQEWLGHSDIGTTANIYSHLDYKSKITSANVMDNILTLPDTRQTGWNT